MLPLLLVLQLPGWLMALLPVQQPVRCQQPWGQLCVRHGIPACWWLAVLCSIWRRWLLLKPNTCFQPPTVQERLSASPSAPLGHPSLAMPPFQVPPFAAHRCWLGPLGLPRLLEAQALLALALLGPEVGVPLLAQLAGLLCAELGSLGSCCLHNRVGPTPEKLRLAWLSVCRRDCRANVQHELGRPVPVPWSTCTGRGSSRSTGASRRAAEATGTCILHQHSCLVRPAEPLQAHRQARCRGGHHLCSLGNSALGGCCGSLRQDGLRLGLCSSQVCQPAVFPLEPQPVLQALCCSGTAGPASLLLLRLCRS